MPISPIKAHKTLHKKVGNEQANQAVEDPRDVCGTSAKRTPVSAYDEAQKDELEVLESIFMEDYEKTEIQTRSAWSRPAEKCFKLTLRAHSNTGISIILAVTLTATYPKSIPLLTLSDASGVRDKYLEKIRSVILIKPKQLVGEVMIYEIAINIQDVLEDAATEQIRGEELPSLEEERVMHEAAVTQLALQKEKEASAKLKEEKADEDRMLQQMLEEEMRRREEARKRRRSVLTDMPAETKAGEYRVVFDQPISFRDEQATESFFRAVNVVSKLSKGPCTSVLLVAPVLSIPLSAALVIKRAGFFHCHVKSAILKLEDELEKLKKLRHPNIINVFDFNIENDKDRWRFDILTDYGSRGSLVDMLNIVEILPVHKARAFAIELLQALDFYHKSGIVHGRLHAGNVLFSWSATGGNVLKLGDAEYQDALYAMQSNSKPQVDHIADIPNAWEPPEFADKTTSMKTRKSDIWNFGIVLVKMLFGLDVLRKYASPSGLMSNVHLSDALEDLMREVFRPTASRRPSAFDTIPFEFLRNDLPAVIGSKSPNISRTTSYAGTHIYHQPKMRKESSVGPMTNSRYASEWDQTARLGRGGYGEVVKARNKLDGRIYAIKKITNKTPAELSQVLSEVHLLATLNHPYVVRYYTAWPEDEIEAFGNLVEEASYNTSSDLQGPSEASMTPLYSQSAGGLDFMSSSGYPKIEFGAVDDDDDDEDDAGDGSMEYDSEAISDTEEQDTCEDASKGLIAASEYLDQKRTRSSSRAIVRSTLFIQMEYCERLTLRDMIRKGFEDKQDELWRVLRQIIEGLMHIHQNGIIHRDLKPENIFLSITNDPKIGDFGLATTGQYFLADKNTNKNVAGDMTRSVGTAMYVAPELRSGTSGHYTDRVDMYSLGIILFEMCHPLKTAMERHHVLSALREKDHILPPEFQNADKVVQGEIIESLLQHRPSERPSSAELLRSGKLPIQIEDETIRLALQGLSDASSPYYHKMMRALFSQTTNRNLRDQLWDLSRDSQPHAYDTDYMLLQALVKDKLTSCFRRHGGVELARQDIFPRSSYYNNANVVQMLDPSGTLVQLPYDLTLPYARLIAKQANVPEKSFTFGTVYREASTGGAPRSNREADFDIISYDFKDLALKEAEIIKLMDDILDAFPPLASAPMCYHIAHSNILEIIMEFCRVDPSQRSATKEVLGKLNIHQWNWAKIRIELRSAPINLSSTTLDELAQFDFRDTPQKCFARLQPIFDGTEHFAKLLDAFTHISGVVEYLRRFDIRRKVFFSPLSSFNDKFYQGGIMFQCLFDNKKRDILAAGGRYDQLIEDHRTLSSDQRLRPHAVGLNIAWDRIVSSMARYQKQGGNSFLKKGDDPEQLGHWLTRRCDVLVASFDSTALRSIGVKIVTELWSHDISAELAIDTRAPEEVLAHYRNDRHCWVVIIKHDIFASGKPDLKIKCIDKKEDADVRSTDLVSFLRGEIRERDHREGTNERAKLFRRSENSEGLGSNRKGNVKVLVAGHKSKKTNKWRVVEAAQTAARELANSFLDAPIASIETRDEVMDMIQTTTLSDAESWRRVIQDVTLQERQYLQEVHDLLSGFKSKHGGKCFIYNFRTGRCIDYDLRK